MHLMTITTAMESSNSSSSSSSTSSSSLNNNNRTSVRVRQHSSSSINSNNSKPPTIRAAALHAAAPSAHMPVGVWLHQAHGHSHSHSHSIHSSHPPSSPTKSCTISSNNSAASGSSSNSNTRLPKTTTTTSRSQQTCGEPTASTIPSTTSSRKYNTTNNNRKKQQRHQGQQQQQRHQQQQPSFLDPIRWNQIPRFTRDEIMTGRVIGRGGFGVVRDVTSIQLLLSSQTLSSSSNRRPSHTTTATSSTITTPSSSLMIHGSSGHRTSAAAVAGLRLFRHTTCKDITSDNKNKPNSIMDDPTTTSTTHSGYTTTTTASTNTANNNNTTLASSTTTTTTTREQLARRVWSNKKKNGGKYVLKEVELLQTGDVNQHNDNLNTPLHQTYMKGIMDLALEARFLASLSHPYIVELRGLAATLSGQQLEPNNNNNNSNTSNNAGAVTDIDGGGGVMSAITSGHYFIILDKLQETLPKRLNTWMHRDRACKGITGALTSIGSIGKNRRKELLLDRLLVAHDIASAMCYLHGKNIIYRDLKPDNIGFDEEGVLKLFDFGLAKELHESCKDGCLFHMTGFTGAIRYMAPEIGLYQPYNLLSDVYSWSMLFWYLLALQPPMGLYTPSMFLDRVFQRGHRPAMKESWPEDWTNLMRACWDADIMARPSFQEIRQSLKKFIRKIDPEVASFMHDNDSTTAHDHDHHDQHDDQQQPSPPTLTKSSNSILKTEREAGSAHNRIIQSSSTTTTTTTLAIEQEIHV